MIGRRILIQIFTHEAIGRKMAGPGIRAWEMALALSKHGFTVKIASPHRAGRAHPAVQFEQFSWESEGRLLQLTEDADVVLATGPVLARVVHVLGRPLDKPTVVDLYDVAEIEQILAHIANQSGGPDPTKAFILEMQTYLQSGDFYLCASQRQLDYWLGAMMAAGRIHPGSLAKDPTLQNMFGIVPYGLG